MSRISLRIFVITLILSVVAVVAVCVNWSSRAEAASESQMTPVLVFLPDMTATQGSVISVPITVGDVTGLGVISYDFHMAYDPAILQPEGLGFDVTGTLSAGMVGVLCNLDYPGHISCGAFQVLSPIAGSGTLLNFRFVVVGTSGQSTALRFENWTQPNGLQRLGFRFNEGNPQTFTIAGSMTVTGGTPTASPTPTATATATPTASPNVIVPVRVSLPNVNAAPGSVISVPVTVTEMTGLQINFYQLQVTFDPAVLQPASPAYYKTGTLSDASFIYVNPMATSGHLILQANPPTTSYFGGSGTLAYLRFIVVGTSGQSTALIFEDFIDQNNYRHRGFAFNDGSPSNTTTNGNVTVSNTAIAGNVTYGNASGAPRLVPDVILSGAGSVAGLAMSGANGSYLYSGFGSGSYTLYPSKTGDINTAISSYDAALVAQHAAGVIVLGTYPTYAANVSGDNSVTSYDAALIAKYVTGPPYEGLGIGSTATWKFLPSSRIYASTGGTIVNEDYNAVLMGEVSGNWTNTGSRPTGGR